MFGVTLFSVRISSAECGYRFDAIKFAWFYDPGVCAQTVQKTQSKLIQFQIITSYCFNFITFLKICFDVRRKSFLEDSQLRSRLTKTKWRLAQCVAQDLFHIIDVTFYVNESEGYGVLVNFIFNTFVWNMAHVLDGFIMLFMLQRVRFNFQTTVSVVVSSYNNNNNNNNNYKKAPTPMLRNVTRI
ncbi:unnamed protein product [Caenorhabditis bovis]|nr:unnamed protein product [Caenorhabditis bovis]